MDPKNQWANRDTPVDFQMVSSSCLSDFTTFPKTWGMLGVFVRVFLGLPALLGPNASRPGKAHSGRTVNPGLQLDSTKKTSALRCGINSSCSIDCQFNTPNNCNRVEIRFLATLPAAKICVHPLKQTLFLSWNLLRGTVLPWSWVINQDQEVAY